MTKKYDIIIIGAGMAGLYTGYLLRKMSPDKSFIILESNPYVGGRALNDKFHGVTIAPGAGIGRLKKDKLLYNLMEDVGLDINKFPFNPNYAISPVVNVKKVMKYLRSEYSEYSKDKNKDKSFESFAIEHLGNEFFKKFVESSGYSDYLKEDVHETFNHYGMEDNYCCWEGFSVPWDTLTKKMVKVIGKKRIKLSTVVKSIRIDIDNYIRVTDTEQNVYESHKIVIATAIDTVRKLLKNYKYNYIYKEVKGQPFMRLFAQFSKESIPLLKNVIEKYTIVSGPLQKIIPIDRDKGLYMIAYNDNKNARYVYRHSKPKELARMVEKALDLPENSLKIKDIKMYYWPIGTHYFTPLDRKEYKNRRTFLKHAQHPHPSIFVVGEAFSLNQGWTEGALESVKKIYKKL